MSITEEQTYQHWRLLTDADQILWLTFDKANQSVNTLNRAVLEEFDLILDQIQQKKISAKAMVILSGKSSGFIAGADIEQFSQIIDVNQAFDVVKKGQQVYDKLAALTLPTVAMIDGFCMGGGTEMALACDYRIAEESAKTRIGLPEILLGIHPGWGGSVRLIKLIGALKAMDIMLTGRAVPARLAAKLGMVDEAVPKRQLLRAARHYALKAPPRHHLGWMEKAQNLPFIRPLLGHLLRRMVETKETPKTLMGQLRLIFDKKIEIKITPEQYPAPFMLIALWVEYGAKGVQAYVGEAKNVAQLLISPTCKNLVRIFELQQQLKNLAKQLDFKPTHVHVIGAGTMGGDIAAWCAIRGFTVTLQDREPKYLTQAIKRASRLFQDKFRGGREAQAAMDRLIPDIKGVGIEKADVIIEAIFENLSAKQALFAEIEKRAKPTAILATNTSSIPLDEISTILQQPQRLVGIHFFNPVAKMQLVEIVTSAQTDPLIAKQAMAFVGALDRLPLPVKSSPGFLVNRILMPYLNEAMVMLDEGISPTAIDRAALAFGMPMGPIELADTVGLDVCLSVAKNLSAHYDGVIPAQLQSLVSAGLLGRKTQAGFYTYKQGRAVKPAMQDKVDLKALSERMIGKMLVESQSCLSEGVVANSDLLDVGMIFGTGFAPFRGGPMHYYQSLMNHSADANKMATDPAIITHHTAPLSTETEVH